MPELIVRKWDLPVSFEIFKEYGVCKARRGDNGEIQFEDPDPTSVIQQAIDNTPETGGKIIIKNGTYRMTSGLFVEGKNNFALQGEGKVVLDFSGITSNFTALAVRGVNENNFAHDICIDNLELIGTNIPDFSQGVFVYRANRVSVTNIKTINFAFQGIVLGEIGRSNLYYVDGFYVANIYDENSKDIIALNHVKNGVLVNINGYNEWHGGIWFHYGETADNYPDRDITVVGLNACRDDWGSNTIGVRFSNCPFKNITFMNINIDTWTRGVWLSGENAVGIRFYGGRIENCSNGVIAAALNFLNYPETFIFRDIYFYNNDYNVRTNTDAGKCIYENCYGFKTENCGTATIPSGQASVTFAHGLDETPTVVVLGATHSEVADAVWSADDTNITITVPSAVSADRDISWYAKYKP